MSPTKITIDVKHDLAIIEDGQDGLARRRFYNQAEQWRNIPSVIDMPLMPRTTRALYGDRRCVIAVVELPPKVMPFFSTCGGRPINLAVPYIILAVPFTLEGRPCLQEDQGEIAVFFRKEPLRSLDDLLLGSALPVSYHNYPFYICLGHQMQRAASDSTDPFKYIPATTSYMVNRLLHTESYGLGNIVSYANVKTVEEYEAMSRKNPNFGLTVDWPTALDHINKQATLRSHLNYTHRYIVSGRGRRAYDERMWDHPRQDFQRTINRIWAK